MDDVCGVIAGGYKSAVIRLLRQHVVLVQS